MGQFDAVVVGEFRNCHRKLFPCRFGSPIIEDLDAFPFVARKIEDAVGVYFSACIVGAQLLRVNMVGTVPVTKIRTAFFGLNVRICVIYLIG